MLIKYYIATTDYMECYHCGLEIWCDLWVREQDGKLVEAYHRCPNCEEIIPKPGQCTAAVIVPEVLAADEDKNC